MVYRLPESGEKKFYLLAVSLTWKWIVDGDSEVQTSGYQKTIKTTPLNILVVCDIFDIGKIQRLLKALENTLICRLSLPRRASLIGCALLNVVFECSESYYQKTGETYVLKVDLTSD